MKNLILFLLLSAGCCAAQTIVSADTIQATRCSEVSQIQDARCFSGTDVFAQIQACLNALPATGGTCDAQSFQGTFSISNVLTFSHPATILFGDAFFNYGGTSVLFNVNAKGVVIQGKGRGFDSGGCNGLGGSFGGRTVFCLTNNNASRHLVATDADNLTIQDVSFIGPGIDASSGGGIRNTLSGNSNLEALIYRNVEVSDVTNTAISVNTPITSIFENILVRKGASDGLDFFNGGTTVSCIECFALTFVGRGIAFDNMTSVHVSGGASESSGVAWDINGSTGVVLDGTDAEAQVDRTGSGGQPGHAYRITGSTGVTLISPKSRSVPSSSSRHILVTGNSKNVRIIDPVIAEGANTPTFDIETDSGSSGVKLDGIDSASVTISDGATNTIIEDAAGGINTKVVDFSAQTAPGNPAPNNVKIYVDSGTGQLTCRNSSGGSCLSATAAPPLVSTSANPAGSGIVRCSGNQACAVARTPDNTTDVQLGYTLNGPIAVFGSIGGSTSGVTAEVGNLQVDGTSKLGGETVSHHPHFFCSGFSVPVAAQNGFQRCFATQAVVVEALSYNTNSPPGAGCTTQPTISVLYGSPPIDSSSLTLTNGNAFGDVNNINFNIPANTAFAIHVKTGPAGCTTNWSNVAASATVREQ
jgi:hypothetical protein